MSIVDDSTNHEKCACSCHGFQRTCLLCIYIAVGKSRSLVLQAFLLCMPYMVSSVIRNFSFHNAVQRHW